jgi:hypothetical protein
MEAYRGRVDEIVETASRYLSDDAIRRVTELVDHNEAPIGVSYLAWAIVNERRHVPRSLIRAIRANSGDEDLPNGLDDFGSD